MDPRLCDRIIMQFYLVYQFTTWSLMKSPEIFNLYVKKYCKNMVKGV